MALESGNITKITELDSASPSGTDLISEADDHIRHIKRVLKTTFGAIDEPVTSSTDELNTLDGYTGDVTDLNYLKDLHDQNVSKEAFAFVGDLSSAAQAQLNTITGTTVTGDAAVSFVKSGTQDAATLGDNISVSHKAKPAALADVTATTGTFIDAITFDAFGHIATVGTSVAVPTGVIVLWSGASDAIPTGWVLCDGQNSTPDLRNKFVVGAGSTYAVNATGGATSVTLTTANLPAHTHSFSATTGEAGDHTHTITDPGHSHVLPYGDSGGEYDGWDGSGNSSNTNSATTGITINSAGAHTHSVTGDTGETGSGTAVDTLPPYFALCYIMKS